jgi:hypothetical protein
MQAGALPDSPQLRVDANVASSPYAGVVSINMRFVDASGQQVGTLCSGSAISPSHILTAAHCVDPFDTGVVIDLAQPLNDVRIALNDKNVFDPATDIFAADRVTIHPDWPGFANCPFGNPGCLNDDLAIIRLARPLPGTVPIYSIFDQPVSPGTVFTMVGYGDSGNGIDGYTVEADFFVKRVGANVFDVFDRDDEQGFSPTSPPEIWGFDFDGVKDGVLRDGFCERIGICSEILPNGIETLLGAGDSGGPSFIRTAAGELVVVGINTFHFTFAYGTDDTSGDFGDSAGGVLLHSYRDWISAMAVPEPDSLALLALALGALAAFSRRRARARP